MKGTYFNADGTSLELTAVKGKGGLYDLKKDGQVIVAGCVASDTPEPGHVVLSADPPTKAELKKVAQEARKAADDAIAEALANPESEELKLAAEDAKKAALEAEEAAK